MFSKGAKYVCILEWLMGAEWGTCLKGDTPTAGGPFFLFYCADHNISSHRKGETKGARFRKRVVIR